jgi:hypothetical protein
LVQGVSHNRLVLIFYRLRTGVAGTLGSRMEAESGKSQILSNTLSFITG